MQIDLPYSKSIRVRIRRVRNRVDQNPIRNFSEASVNSKWKETTNQPNQSTPTSKPASTEALKELQGYCCVGTLQHIFQDYMVIQSRAQSKNKTHSKFGRDQDHEGGKY